MFDLLNQQLHFLGIYMTVIDLIGSILGIIYIILEYKASRWLWPFCIAMGVCVAYSCFVNQFYANGAINVYYVLMGIYGIYQWRKLSRGKQARVEQSVAQTDTAEAPMQSLPRNLAPWVIAAMLLLSAGLYFLLHGVGENNVVLGIDLTILDAITSAISIVAMWMLAHKYYQQWICWIVVDPITVALFLLGGSYPLAIMYAVYVVISIMGYLKWKKDFEKEQK